MRCVLFIMLCLVSPLWAADDRPTIGLALSGGGSKAGAHIGVLRVLEAQRIPIDYIAGTSAGAIVGGLYAAGLSPDEIEAAIAEIDWNDIVRDAPPRVDLPFRRKRDDQNYLVKARPGFNNARITLPMGLVQGQKITHFFRRHLGRHSGAVGFEALTIPLKVVTTDLETGDAVILDSGDLALAIRASMSIPVAFAPVSIGGRRLIDGGAANNLPVDVVREMGADIVIAVDITAPLLSSNELDSVLSVTDQLTNFLTRRNVREQLAKLSDKDILIQPTLNEFGALAFDKTLLAIEPGERAANAVTSRLTPLAVNSSDYAHYQNLRSAPATAARRLIDFIEITNRSTISTAAIRQRLNLPIGEPVNRRRIERGIANVYGMDVFERIDYRLVERNNKTGIVVEAVPKPWGPNYLQFGLRLAEDFSTGSDFDLGVAYLQTAVNERGGEWRAQLDVGERQGLSFDWHQPMSHESGLFWEAQLQLLRRNFRIFDDDGPASDLRVSGWGGNFSLGRELGTFAELRVGWNRFTGDLDVNIGQLDAADADALESGELFASAVYDRLDNANFPRSGAAGGLVALWSTPSAGASDRFEQLFANYLVAGSRGDDTLFVNLEAGTTRDNDAPPQSQFLLGGLGRLSGFPDNRFIGQHYALANLTAYRRLGDNRWFPLYAGFSLEAGNVWDDRSDASLDSLTFAGALYGGADTPIGPVYLAWGLAEGRNSTTYLYLGNPFNSRQARPLN